MLHLKPGEISSAIFTSYDQEYCDTKSNLASPLKASENARRIRSSNYREKEPNKNNDYLGAKQYISNKVKYDLEQLQIYKQMSSPQRCGLNSMDRDEYRSYIDNKPPTDTQFSDRKNSNKTYLSNKL